LPRVRIDKEYVFDTDEGEQSLRGLSAGRSQLLVYHFMFGPTWSAGCPTCALRAESFDRAVIHLNQRDATMVCASRGPLAQLNAYKQRMGLTFRSVSPLASDFNCDFGVSLRAGADRMPWCSISTRHGRRYYNEEHAGLSAFALEEGVVYYTYSCHLRGLEEFNVTYQLLYCASRDRDEDKLPYPRLGSIAGTNLAPVACRALRPTRFERLAIIVGGVR
jgi:predicted dithiol-disulfide oxidoreductase (DUF899 family)